MNITRLFLSFGIILIALTFASVQPSVSLAQETNDIAADLEPLLNSAKEKGLSVIVVTPENKEEVATDVGPSFTERVLNIRSEVQRIFSKAPEAIPTMKATLDKRSPDGTYNWLWIAIATAVAGILIAKAPAILLRNWAQQHFKDIYNPDPQNDAEKVGYLMFRAFTILLNMAILAAVSILVAVIFDSGHDPSRATIGIIIGGYITYKVFRHVIFFNLIAPDTPSHRMLNINDEDADMMQRDWRTVIPFVVVICSFFIWMALIGLPGDALKLLVMISLLVSALLVGLVFLKHKRQFKEIILGAGDPTTKPAWRRLLASQFHLIIIGYLAIAWGVSSLRIVQNLPSSLAVIGAPVVALIGAIACYGILLIIIGRVYAIRQNRFEERVAIAHEQNRLRLEAEKAALEEALANPPEDDEELVVNKIMSSRELEEMPIFKPVFKDLLEDAAGIFVSFIAFGYILAAWDVNLGQSGNPVTEFIDTLAIAFIGWFLYRAVIAYIDNQLLEEGEDASAQDGEPGEEMSGKSASRIGTLLPLLRNVMVTAIVVLSAMVILSNLGVDIAPLFAGAGVIGLAVGFGAQTLIRDIFSGGFFLFDDAFRKGEYIEMDQIRGTVEKISLRSFQLRHHNGPLHTIPFGEIKQLTNYSRDWVMMKLPLRVTYDTDVERVRKLVKKLGQRLLDHPEVGDLFVQPLKSQGVYQMEDSAMIIRVKFMTKPGDQFVTRKVVYAAIRELFEQEGIKFANKEVTVRLADEPDRQLTEQDKSKIAAAAARSSADDALAAPKPDDGP